jgi:CRP-like cAMP-binding protein
MELMHQGEAGQFAYIRQSGWGCNFRIRRDGARQIITFLASGN